MKSNQNRKHLLCSAKLGVPKAVVGTIDLTHVLIFASNKLFILGRTVIIVCETRHPLKVETTVQMSRKQRSLFFPILRHTKKTIDVSLSLLDLRRLKKKKKNTCSTRQLSLHSAQICNHCLLIFRKEKLKNGSTLKSLDNTEAAAL